MSEMKKIILSLPEELLETVDDQLKYEEISRRDGIRRALGLALEQAKKDRIRARMKQGYQEMGLLNMELAEEALAADTSDFAIYESILESE